MPSISPPKRPLVLASFLPGFHDCPLNSSWWGPGFTELMNVEAAKPLYSGHNQPNHPLSDNYDLSDRQCLASQFTLAQQYGIDSFIIYDYWSLGKRPLSRPLECLLRHQEIPFRFGICWANHDWTRSWKNRAGAYDQLFVQDYEPIQEYRSYFDHLVRVFSDHRYLTVSNKIYFSIYQPLDIPNLDTFIKELRNYIFEQTGKEMFINALTSSESVSAFSPDLFDSFSMYQPSAALGSLTSNNRQSLLDKLRSSLKTRVTTLPPSLIRVIFTIQDLFESSPRIFDYQSVTAQIEAATSRFSIPSGLRLIPMTFVNFDNTPRYHQRARITRGYTSYLFQKHLERMLTIANSLQSPIFIVNAWNEFGEGMHLYPCNIYGKSRLQALSRAIRNIFPN